MAERKLTREEKSARRSLEKAFQTAHKQQAKSAGWGYLKPTAFKRIGEWFVTLDPIIWTDAERAQLQATIKPFAIDDLMSHIMGHGGLDGSPLSLRARGPHTLVIPMWTQDIEAEGNIDAMLRLSADFAEEVCAKVQSLLLDDFIEFVSRDYPVGKVKCELVAAMILNNRLGDALTLCEQAIATKQWGGPARVTEDGRIIGFFEFAKLWINRTEMERH